MPRPGLGGPPNSPENKAIDLNLPRSYSSIMSNPVERRLAAIVAADVVGYSRLMSADETGTILAVRRLQTDILEPLLQEYGGRMVKTMGDGFLIEFPSVVAGVKAATQAQKALGAMEAGENSTRKLQLRIGVHVGDIVIEDTDIFGEGVNIAARIEPLASPGGVGISDDAYRQVRDRIDLAWVDGGRHALKNIPRPVRIWHWNADGAAADKAAGAATITTAAPPLPEKPSIAVLPFLNMSGDSEQEAFADGMTEDLITDLSKVSGLFVVARNSTFAFKGQSPEIAVAARQLGVRHVVEGSVRKSGSRARINVQLIDATTGGQVWADRYDGSIEDVFELQDSVCAEVVSALSVRLTQQEANLINQVHTRNVDAYELFVRAKATPYPPIPERISAAREMFERVIKMDPEFAGGYAGSAWMIGFNAIWGQGNRTELAAEAEALGRKAIAVDDSFGWSHLALGMALWPQGRFDEAHDELMRALELLPNDADAHAFCGMMAGVTGDRIKGMEALDAAMRLNPQFINGPYLNLMALLKFLDGDFAGTIEAHEANVARGGPTGPPALAWSAAAHHALGNDQAAAAAIARLRQRFPGFSLKQWNFFGLFPKAEDADRVRRLMAEAGVRND